jgi:hypothetical protein
MVTGTTGRRTGGERWMASHGRCPTVLGNHVAYAMTAIFIYDKSKFCGFGWQRVCYKLIEL